MESSRQDREDGWPSKMTDHLSWTYHRIPCTPTPSPCSHSSLSCTLRFLGFYISTSNLVTLTVGSSAVGVGLSTDCRQPAGIKSARPCAGPLQGLKSDRPKQPHFCVFLSWSSSERGWHGHEQLFPHLDTSICFCVCCVSTLWFSTYALMQRYLSLQNTTSWRTTSNC